MYKCSLKWWFGIWKPVFEDWLCQLAGKFGLSEVFPHRGFSFIRFIFYLQIFIPQGKCHVLTFIPSATLSIWLSVSPSLCIYPSNLCFTVYYISFQKQFLVRRESRWSGWDPTTHFRVFLSPSGLWLTFLVFMCELWLCFKTRRILAMGDHGKEIPAALVAYSRTGLTPFGLGKFLLDGALIYPGTYPLWQPHFIPVSVPGICQNKLICSKVDQCLC